MKKILISLLVILSPCSNAFTQGVEAFLQKEMPGAKKSSQGVYYQLVGSEQAQQPKMGDYVMISYVGRFLDGKIFDASLEGEPMVFQLGKRQVIQGWEEGLLQFHKGAKGKLLIPSEKAYGKRGLGNIIPPDSDLVFEMELLDILDQSAYDSYMVGQEAQARAKFEEEKAHQFEIDKKLIATYIKEKKLKAKTLDSGLSVWIKKKGKGPLAKNGDQLSVKYMGSLLDGTIFDSNMSDQPFEFTLGQGKVIPGWEEGIQHFRKGSLGFLLIPSKLAYGPRPIKDGDAYIPANSSLVFEIKIMGLKASAEGK